MYAKFSPAGENLAYMHEPSRTLTLVELAKLGAALIFNSGG